MSYRYTRYLSSALDGGGWLTPRRGRFNPKKETQYPLYGRLSGTHGRSGQVRKFSPSPGFYSRTAQPVASRYTDWVIPAHFLFK